MDDLRPIVQIILSKTDLYFIPFGAKLMLVEKHLNVTFARKKLFTQHQSYLLFQNDFSQVNVIFAL